MDYNVAGFADGGADKLAPVVDGVLGAQFKRYREFARSQRAEALGPLQRHEGEGRGFALGSMFLPRDFTPAAIRRAGRP